MSTQDIRKMFLGATCQQIIRHGPDIGPGQWRFEFSNGNSLDVSCAWRITFSGCIALGYGDHGNRLRLPQPFDDVAEARKLLAGPIQKVAIFEETGDLTLKFKNGACLELFNSSSAYEGWECRGSGKYAILIVATGGGKLVIFPGVK